MEATAAAPAARRRPSLARYAERRIGDGTTEQQLFNLLVRPFAAPTFAGFWRTFNPLYSYYLYYWSYRPLRRLVPRPLAELITFAVSGFFLHELPLWLVLRAVYGEGGRSPGSPPGSSSPALSRWRRRCFTWNSPACRSPRGSPSTSPTWRRHSAPS